MAGLATTAQVIILGNLGKQIDAAILEPHVSLAEIEMKSILGATLYEAIKGYESGDSEANKETLRTVTIAECFLVLSSAVHSLNIETQGSGIVRSKGWDQSKSELLSRNEVKDLSEYWHGKAMDLIAPLIPEPTVEEDDEDGEPNEIDLGGAYMGSI